MLTLVYRSDAEPFLSVSDLTDLYLRSAAKNRRLGITGFLVECDQVFLQVLEGPAEAVDALFATIRGDRRHHDVVLLIREERGEERVFGFWAMNFGPLGDPAFRQGAIAGMDPVAFRRRSHDPAFVWSTLEAAYRHSCRIAAVNPVVRDWLYGHLP